MISDFTWKSSMESAANLFLCKWLVLIKQNASNWDLFGGIFWIILPLLICVYVSATKTECNSNLTVIMYKLQYPTTSWWWFLNQNNQYQTMCISKVIELQHPIWWQIIYNILHHIGLLSCIGHYGRHKYMSSKLSVCNHLKMKQLRIKFN